MFVAQSLVVYTLIEHIGTWRVFLFLLGKPLVLVDGCLLGNTILMCLLGASRLVLSPRLQTYSVDYTKTFSPIAEIGFLSPLPPILIDPCFYWMSRMSCCMVIPMSKSIWKNYLGLLFMERIVRCVTCVTFTSLFFIKAWFGKFDDIVLRFGMRHCHFDYSISEWL